MKTNEHFKFVGKITVSWLVALVVNVLFVYAALAKGWGAHRKDIINCLFNSEKNEATKELVDYISRGMDMGFGAKPTDLSENGSAYANTVKTEIARIFKQDASGTGPHRSLGHWNMDGDIPREYLQKIEALEQSGKVPPGSRKIFVDTWREFVESRKEAVKQVFSISGPNADRSARSFAAMCSDVHNLGDWTTLDWRGIRPLDQTIADYCRSGNRILGKNNGLTKVIRQEVNKILAKCNDMEITKAVQKIPSGLSEAERATEILKIAEELPDKEFAHALEVNLKGLQGEARIKEILAMPKKFAHHKVAQEVIDLIKNRQDDFYNRIARIFGRMGFDGNWEKIDWEKLKTVIRNIKQEKWLGNVIAQSAKVKEINVGGKVVKQIEVPVVKENGKLYTAAEYMAKNPGKQLQVESSLVKGGVKQGGKSAIVKGAGEIGKWLASPAGQGTSAGILTFLIKEGEAVVAYSNGAMEADEFHTRTAVNVGIAGAEGAAVYVVSASLAGAPVLVTVGSLIVVGIAVEQAGEYVWYRIDREVGTFPGISVDELLYPVDEATRNRRTVIDDFRDYENGHRVKAPIPFSEIK